jgi:hypothetical protein
LPIALLADIHGNLEALEACLRHAGESGATRHVFLGDFVGYGAQPNQVLDTMRTIMRSPLDRTQALCRGRANFGVDSVPRCAYPPDNSTH